MNNNLIIILTIIISGSIGAYLGMLFTKLKSKTDKSTLEERNNNLQQQITELKTFHNSENEKQNELFNRQINELKETVSKIENEREEIRREKELLNAELTKKNTEFENLQHKNNDAKIKKLKNYKKNSLKSLKT